jgi:hypothetical protein
VELFNTALDAFPRAGNMTDLSSVRGELTVFFDREGQPETAAIIYRTQQPLPQ